jgi:hypothetical protein
MSITASYRRLSPQEFERLRADPTAAASYFGDDLEDEDDAAWYAWLDARDADGRYLDIQKGWHALNFLLTGNATMDRACAPPPLGNVVLGGNDTDWEATYGMVRSLAPAEVQAVAAALEQVDEEELRRRFDPASYEAEDIYPAGVPWGEDDLAPLLKVFGQVRAFFSEAAKAGEVVLLSLN